MLSLGRGQHTDNTHTEEMLLQMLNVLREHRRWCTRLPGGGKWHLKRHWKVKWMFDRGKAELSVREKLLLPQRLWWILVHPGNGETSWAAGAKGDLRRTRGDGWADGHPWGHCHRPDQDPEFHLRITGDLQGYSWQEKGVLVFAFGEVSPHGERWILETGDQGREYWNRSD